VTYWEIRTTNLYFDEFCKLPFGAQHNILNQWVNVANSSDPKSQFMMTHCPFGHIYFLVNFFDLEYEFLIEIVEEEKLLRLISCGKPTIYDYHQHD